MDSNHSFDKIPVFKKVALSEDGEYLQFIPSVAILGIPDDGRVLLIEQYRGVVQKNTIELPGGKIEAGEDIFQAAQRELLEEAGYTAGEYELIVSLDMDLSASRHVTHLVWAKLKEYHGHKENTRQLLVDLDQALDMFKNGLITHAPTVVALLWMKLRGCVAE